MKLYAGKAKIVAAVGQLPTVKEALWISPKIRITGVWIFIKISSIVYIWMCRLSLLVSQKIAYSEIFFWRGGLIYNQIIILRYLLHFFKKICNESVISSIQTFCLVKELYLSEMEKCKKHLIFGFSPKLWYSYFDHIN